MVDNGAVHPGPRQVVASLAVLAAPLLLAACTGEAAGQDGQATGAPERSAPAAVGAPPGARDRLRALAAAARDRRYTAVYTFAQAGRPDRNVTVVLAVDGGWRVDVPGGGLGGAANLAMVGGRTGRFQCVLPGSTDGTGRALAPACVQVAGADGTVLPAADPRVELVFTDWLDPLTDRRAALSAADTPLFPGAQGSCFRVDHTAASLPTPIDPGTYCYAPDGTLTAARMGVGVITLAGPPTAAPQSVAMPGPVVPGIAVPTAPPPPPSPSPSGPVPPRR
jgi:hypothetical protein